MILSSVSVVQNNIYRGFAPQQTIDSEKELSSKTPGSASENQLSSEDQKAIKELKARDLEVRTHEQAHLSAAGGIALGGASFTFTTGPDGRRYAIGGDIQVDVSAVAGDPQATIQKAEQIKRAALAPANPSSQDLSVAANASAMANKARAELLKQNQQLDDINPNQENRLGSNLDIIT